MTGTPTSLSILDYFAAASIVIAIAIAVSTVVEEANGMQCGKPRHTRKPGNLAYPHALHLHLATNKGGGTGSFGTSPRRGIPHH
jgi:hypothetical protein